MKGEASRVSTGGSPMDTINIAQLAELFQAPPLYS